MFHIGTFFAHIIAKDWRNARITQEGAKNGFKRKYKCRCNDSIAGFEYDLSLIHISICIRDRKKRVQN